MQNLNWMLNSYKKSKVLIFRTRMGETNPEQNGCHFSKSPSTASIIFGSYVRPDGFRITVFPSPRL